MKRVGIFTATRWELNAVRRALRVETERQIAGARCVLARKGDCQVWLFQTGVGPEKSESVCREALAVQPFDVVISSGFACALAPSEVGELLIGTHVVRHDGAAEFPREAEVLTCSTSLTSLACDAANRVQLRARIGRFVTSSRIAWQAKEKSRIRDATEAIGLDMESSAVGVTARECQVPFLVVRAASDLVDEDLPLDFNLFLSPAGWVRGAVTLLSHPSRVTGLMRLKTQSARASDRLAAFFEYFVEALGTVPVR